MPRRTREERIADRAAARKAAGKELSRRQQSATGTAPSKPKVAEVRAAARASNQSLRDYKASQGITSNRGGTARRANATKTNGNISSYDPNSVGRSKGNKYSHQDIKALKEQGYSLNDIGKHLKESGAENLGSRAKNLRDRYVASLTAAANPQPTVDTTVQEEEATPIPTPTTPKPVTPVRPPVPTTPSNPTIGTGGVVANPDNSQEQNVSQDNDISTDIVGDNNTVVNNQDNSIRQYGGDNRQFIYNGGSGSSSYEDTPVSAATMAGFYDVDDSPAAQAARTDFWTTSNRDNQKRYAGQGLATSKMFSNFDARDYTPEAMQQAIYDSTQHSYDRADVQTGLTLGDIWRSDYAPQWKMPNKPKPVEIDVGSITNDIRDEIENM